MKLVDSHVHLDLMDCTENVIKRAKKTGIVAILAMGANLESNKKTLNLATKYPGYVFPCLGLHPGDIQETNISDTIKHIKDNISKCIAIGEIGLDYSYPSTKSKEVREKQRQIYIELLKLARESSLPISIHSRSAYKDSLSILKEHGPKKAVFHWYDGPLHYLKIILDSGYYVSATPAANYNKGMKAVLVNTPLEQILVETDSPVFLRTQNRYSEPADLGITINALAGIKGDSKENVVRITSKNTETLFHISL